MAAIRFAFADVGNVDLHHHNTDGTDAVGDGYGSMGVSSRIHDYRIVKGIGFLQFVNDETLVVCLEIIDFVLWETLLEMLKIGFKRSVPIDFRFSFPKQIKIRPVDY